MSNWTGGRHWFLDRATDEKQPSGNNTLKDTSNVKQQKKSTDGRLPQTKKSFLPSIPVVSRSLTFAHEGQGNDRHGEAAAVATRHNDVPTTNSTRVDESFLIGPPIRRGDKVAKERFFIMDHLREEFHYRWQRHREDGQWRKRRKTEAFLPALPPKIVYHKADSAHTTSDFVLEDDDQDGNGGMSDNDVGDSDSGHDTQHDVNSAHSDHLSDNKHPSDTATAVEHSVTVEEVVIQQQLDSEGNEMSSHNKGNNNCNNNSNNKINIEDDNDDDDNKDMRDHSNSFKKSQLSNTEHHKDAILSSNSRLPQQATTVNQAASSLPRQTSQQAKDKSPAAQRQPMIIYWSTADPGDKKKKRKPRRASSADVRRRSIAEDVDAVVVIKELSEDIMRQIVKGSLKYECQPVKRVMHLYIHSAETDTEIERRYLTQKTFPQLKAYALQRNCELRVYDLSYPPLSTSAAAAGATNAFDDHSQIGIPALLLENLQSNADNFVFVTLLSHKYGQGSLCTSIDKTEFETIMEYINQAQMPAQRPKQVARRDSLKANDDGEVDADQGQGQTEPDYEDANEPFVSADVTLIKSIYCLDENTLPCLYRLRPISEVFPDFLAFDSAKKSEAQREWTTLSLSVEKLFTQYAAKALPNDAAKQKYYMSQTAKQLLQVKGNAGHKVWIQRTFIDMSPESNPARHADFVDINGAGTAVDQARQKALASLKQTSWLAALPQANVLRYAVSWTDHGGINPVSVRAHALYLDQLCQDVRARVGQLFDDILASEKTRLPVADCSELFQEVNQHVYACHKKANQFLGRTELLDGVKRFMRGFDSHTTVDSGGQALVVHGKAGCGLSSLLARASRDLRHEQAVVIRFIDQTNKSKVVNTLLADLCQQLHFMQKNSLIDLSDIPFNGLVNLLSELILDVEDSLLVVIDSPHLVTDALGDLVHCEDWLPEVLPPGVRLVIGVNSNEAARLQSSWKLPTDCVQYLEVPDLQSRECVSIIKASLAERKRSLTADQMTAVIDAFKACPLPLMSELLLYESATWSSFGHSTLKLGTAFKSVMNFAIGRLERSHGDIFTKRALGYLTAAKYGLMYNELEDLLSLDEAALEEININTKLINIRRVPTIRLKRLLNALGSMISETHSDGNVLLRWSHTFYRDYTTERYLHSRDRAPSYHKTLSEYFSDAWAVKPKPAPGSDVGIHRHVTPQPLYWEVPCDIDPVLNASSPLTTQRVFNRRRLGELPYHYFNSQQMDALKNDCLCNYEFILAKVCAGMLDDLLADMDVVLRQEDATIDQDIKLLFEALLLSAPALRKEPRQLATQIAGRLMDYVVKDVPVLANDPLRYPGLKNFMLKAEKGSIPALIPSVSCLTAPGGLKYDILSGHKAPVVATAVTHDGLTAITASSDNTMKLWNIKSKRVTHTFCNVGANVIQIRLADGDAKIITSEKDRIRVWGLKNAPRQCLATVSLYEDPASLVIAGGGKILVAFYHGNSQMCVWQLRDDGMELTMELDTRDEVLTSVHQDNSVLVAQDCLGTIVLHAFKSSNTAIARSVRDGNVAFRLKCGDATSIQALGVTPDYFACAVRVNYLNKNDCFRLDLFDVKNGQYLRGMLGCAVDNISEIFINKNCSHALALCPSDSLNMSSIVVWNIETEDHKHLAKHPKISTVGACVELRNCLTASTSENVVRVWNLSGVINQTVPKEKRQGIEDIQPMVDNTRYVVTRSSPGGLMRVWNVSKGKPSKSIVRTERGIGLQGHIILVRNAKVVILAEKNHAQFSKNEFFFQTILFYDLKHKRFGKKLTGCFIVPCLQNEYIFLDDNNLLGLSDARNHFMVWSLETGQLVRRIKPNLSTVTTGGRPADDQAVAEKNKRQRQTTAKMMAWDRRNETHTARSRRRQAEISQEKELLDSLRQEKDNNIEQFLVSGDGKVIITSHFAHHAFIFDVPTGTHRLTLQTPDSLFHLRVSALTSNGSHLIHTNYSEDTQRSYVTLWNCTSGVIKRRLRDETEVCAVTINDAANVVVLLKDRSNVHVWKPRRPNSLTKIRGPAFLNFQVTSQVHIIDSGSKVVIFDGNVSVWDIDQGTLLAMYMPDTNIQSFSVALNGRLIVLGMRNIPDLIILRLMSKNLDPLQYEGEDVFGEVSSSSSEDEGNEEDDEGAKADDKR